VIRTKLDALYAAYTGGRCLLCMWGIRKELARENAGGVLQRDRPTSRKRWNARNLPTALSAPGTFGKRGGIFCAVGGLCDAHRRAVILWHFWHFWQLFFQKKSIKNLFFFWERLVLEVVLGLGRAKENAGEGGEGGEAVVFMRRGWGHGGKKRRVPRHRAGAGV
jgi:hypothetical protein